MSGETKTVKIQYIGSFCDDSGLREETIETTSKTPLDLIEEIRVKRSLRLSCGAMRIVINGKMAGWHDPIQNGDEVAFYPPVGGG